MAAVAPHFLCPPVSASAFTSVSPRSRGRALTIGSTTSCSDVTDGLAKFSIMESITVDSLDFSPERHRGERCVDVPCDRSKSAMAITCCTNFLSVHDATDCSDDDENRYLFRSRSQTNVAAAAHHHTKRRTTRSHSTLSTGHLSLSLPGSSSPECSPSVSPCGTPKAFGDDMGQLVIDFASCLDFQITTEHVQIPTIDIYALAKKHSSKYGSSRTNRQKLFRADSGNPMCAPKPRSVSTFESLLSTTPNDEDIDMRDDDSSHERGVLARAQSDSVVMKASPSSPPSLSLLRTAKRVKGACGGKTKNVSDSENPRRRRALDFSEAFTVSTKAPSPSEVPITDISSFGGRQRSPSVSRPSTLTRKRSRDFLGRDHDHPANMPLQRGRKNQRSRLADDCSNSPCLNPELPPASLSKIMSTETPEADFPLPSTPSLSSQSHVSYLSRSPSSPSLRLSLASDSFTLNHNEHSTSGHNTRRASKESHSSNTSPSSSSNTSQKSDDSESSSPTLSENILDNNNKPISSFTAPISSFTAFLNDCDTDPDRERRSGPSVSSKENRDPFRANSANVLSLSMENSSWSGMKRNGATRRTLAMGAFDDDSDEEMMEASKPEPIKLPQTNNVSETLLPLRMAPLNPIVLSPPKSAPALISSLAQDPRLIHSRGFTFGLETHTSRTKKFSHEKLRSVTVDTKRVAHTRARSNTHTRQVHTCTVDQLPRNLSLSEMSQTWPNVQPKPVMGSTVGTKSSTDQTQLRKNSGSRPVPVMLVPNFVSLDVVNENTAMDDGDCCTETASESDSSPSRSCKTVLPIVRKNCMIPEISGATLRDLFAGAYRDKFDHFVVVDCRYVYEYRGGHIKGALNLWRKNDLTAFYHANRDLGSNKRVALIFHCEYSKNRAPRAAAHFRKLDRDRNDYPRLSFPHLFVLNRGYRQFYRSLQADSNGSMDVYCDPPTYVSMWDEKFVRENKMCKDLEKPRRGGARSRTASTPDVW